MSRIGAKPITIDEGVSAVRDGDFLVVSSDGKSQQVKIHKNIGIDIKDQKLTVTRSADDKVTKSLHGLTRSLIKNAFEGVKNGYQKDLEVVGVGYRAQVEQGNMMLKLGFSHDVTVEAPEGIEFEVKKNTISVKGYDKQLVGQVAAKIRSLREPEPYKGKGIKYKGEIILRKVGKAVKAAGEPGA